MAGYDAHLVNLVDARIRESATKATATGTLVSTSGNVAWVVMDGDSLALPCKFVGGLSLLPDARVVLHKYGDDWTVTGDFAKGYWPRRAYDQTVIAGFINTSAAPALGSPEVGFTFVAPPSGEVEVTVGGFIAQATNANTTHMTFSIRSGDTWADGVPVLGFDYRRGISAGKAVTVSGPPEVGAANMSPVPGLDPGATYVIRMGHWVAPAGSGTVAARYVRVDQV